MKLYYVTTVLLILFSSAVAGIFDIESIDLDQLGVLVLLNKGRPSVDGSFCSPEDESLIQASLNQVLPFTFRNLRAGGDEPKQHGRELVNCRKACQGYARGSCYVVHSSCKGYRRELVSDEKEEESNTQEKPSRSVPRNLFVIKAIKKTCSRLLKGVEVPLVSIIHEVEGLSSPCLKLIQKKIAVECELLDDDE